MPVGRALLVSSTLVVWGLIAHSLITGYALPWGAGVLLMVAYLAVFFLGAVMPSLEMYGDVLSRVPGGRAGAFALTFDDGPDERSTPEVLRLLAKHGHRATFFVIGEKAEAHPEILHRIVDEGHELALHSMHHPYTYAFLSPSSVEQDLLRTQAILERITGRKASFFRPPVLVLSPRTVKGAERVGVAIAGSSVRAFDGKSGSDPEKVKARLARAKAGDIVLLHDASEVSGGPLPSSLGFLEERLDEWKKAGLVSLTLSELVRSTNRSSTLESDHPSG